MKKKTIYNIIMFTVIAAIAAAAVLLVGRHKGWFDKPTPADDATDVALDATLAWRSSAAKRLCGRGMWSP